MLKDAIVLVERIKGCRGGLSRARALHWPPPSSIANVLSPTLPCQVRSCAEQSRFDRAAFWRAGEAMVACSERLSRWEAGDGLSAASNPLHPDQQVWAFCLFVCLCGLLTAILQPYECLLLCLHTFRGQPGTTKRKTPREAAAPHPLAVC